MKLGLSLIILLWLNITTIYATPCKQHEFVANGEKCDISNITINNDTEQLMSLGVDYHIFVLNKQGKNCFYSDEDNDKCSGQIINAFLLNTNTKSNVQINLSEIINNKLPPSISIKESFSMQCIKYTTINEPNSKQPFYGCEWQELKSGGSQ